MEILKGYRRGLNLGGWISQYKRYMGRGNHLEEYTTRRDLERIAQWGFDHVRLPFDYDVLEPDEHPYVYREEGFAYIDRCLEWCEACGLNMVLDFHLAPDQNIYPPSVPNPLFRDAPGTQRYRALWRAIARRYKGVGGRLIFDLLNEAIDPNSFYYNRFYTRTVAEIRQEDANRPLLVGGIDYNSVFALRELALLDDPLVAYSFHFYEPFQFAAQHAPWCADIMPYKQDLHFPGDFGELKRFLDEHPEHARRFGMFVWRHDDPALLEELLLDAILFKQDTGKELYCGEYGVINLAPEEDKERYLTALVDLLNRCDIPHACWCYKECDFGLVNFEGALLHEKLPSILTR